MPLDGHAYLSSYGWTKGSGLRKGALERPLAIPQKKTLAGLGKDRDEAFPFWDHVFAAAAKAIVIKADSDDESEDGDLATGASLHRTQTGIISNRRPVLGTPASGLSTPSETNDGPQLSLVAMAKREAARRGLYSRFFRGPVLGPDDDETTKSPEIDEDAMVNKVVIQGEHKSKKRKLRSGEEEEVATTEIVHVEVHESKKRKSREEETEEERKQRRRAKKEAKALKEARRAEKAKRKEEKRLKKEAREADSGSDWGAKAIPLKEAKYAKKQSKKEKKKTKEESQRDGLGAEMSTKKSKNREEKKTKAQKPVASDDEAENTKVPLESSSESESSTDAVTKKKKGKRKSKPIPEPPSSDTSS
ncbi:hypothetical protein CONPUDRAFT_90090 [Coniophora puteana RWD-64-598 SS2]|uniref:G-patch domain-containing protein n=1 Tax=Coniophora puteana (strain RWD-64-598) TaxID=741705 RepID=A0A5M3MPN9_CONPW|nr:uncharacterized protein CONPUDRAFT_90090 [Coniophora puteana RWD-64-598 SS2]EIW81026.1 hypothetical protein CONPUDRAFT_90090 [Coniophora puteana RWD-64-598 SS2]